MNVRQDFKVKMYLVEDNGAETPVAPALCEAIVGWDVETLEEDDDDDTQGFLVPDNAAADDDGDDEEPEDDAEDGDDEGDESEGIQPEKLLALTAKVNAQMLEEFKELTSSIRDLKIRFVYGTAATGQLIKEFDADSDAVLTMTTGHVRDESASDRDLEVDLLFDVYGSDTLY